MFRRECSARPIEQVGIYGGTCFEWSEGCEDHHAGIGDHFCLTPTPDSDSGVALCAGGRGFAPPQQQTQQASKQVGIATRLPPKPRTLGCCSESPLSFTLVVWAQSDAHHALSLLIVLPPLIQGCALEREPAETKRGSQRSRGKGLK